MTPQLESVILNLTIQKRRAGIEFCVMQTPLPLWEALPQEEKRIPAYEGIPGFSTKGFTLKVAGKFYEFTFYRSEARP